jgi:radical SAM superfamily enzyme YgiQ (UPF0313 family)
VAEALRTNGHTVEFFDWAAEDYSVDRLRESLASFQPELIGLSIRNIDNANSIDEERCLDRAEDVIALLRTVSPAPIVLGGAGFSLMPEAILRRLNADYGIVGEGEQAMVAFADTLTRQRPPRFTLLRAETRLPPERLGRADYTLSCAEYYRAHGGVIGIQTKRGCPHECAYCTYPLLEGRTLRPRPAAAVVDDIQQLIADHVPYIFFVDGVFNDEGGLYMKVIREMQARRVRVYWTAYFAPRAIPDEHWEAMLETGLSAAEVGSDAATDETLRGLQKPHTWRQIVDFHEALRRHRVPTAHHFIFGGPGETPATVQAGIAHVRSLEGAARFIFSGIRVLPGTAIASRYAREMGRELSDDELLDPRYYFSPALPRAELEAALRDGFAGDPLCLYPPEENRGQETELHRKGFCGPGWVMLLGRRPPRRIVRHA